MKEIALQEAGASIARASCHHDEYSPKNIIDSTTTKPWLTSGLFPQHVIISFQSNMHIQSIDIKCCNVEDILVEGSTTTLERANFFEISEKTLEKNSGSIQTENITNEELLAKHLKVTILSGYDIFCGIFKLIVNGSESSLAGGTDGGTFNSRNSFGSPFTTNTTEGITQKPGGFSLPAKRDNEFRFGEAFHTPSKRSEPDPDSEEDGDDQQRRNSGFSNNQNAEDSNEYAQGFRIPTSTKRVRTALNQEFNEQDEDDDRDGTMGLGGGDDGSGDEVSWNPVLPPQSPDQNFSSDEIHFNTSQHQSDIVTATTNEEDPPMEDDDNEKVTTNANIEAFPQQKDDNDSKNSNEADDDEEELDFGHRFGV